MSRAASAGVVIAAPVTIPYVRYSDADAHWFSAAALAGAGQRVRGRAKEQLDGCACRASRVFPRPRRPDAAFRPLAALARSHIPMGGASGVVALRRARAPCRQAMLIVACIAGDTNHVDSFRQNLSNFSRFARDAVYPLGGGGPNGSFALLTAYYMRQYGIAAADFGKLCVAQRDNALKYPHALLRKPLTLDEYLNARPIADPLRLFDCVMPCAGAEGFLVMTEDRARSLDLPFCRILGTIEARPTEVRPLRDATVVPTRTRPVATVVPRPARPQ